MNPCREIELQASDAKTLKDSAEVLERLLSGGFAVLEDGTLYETRQLVERVNGLRIEVFANEHPPPHFHISGGGIDATFSITDCEHLKGNIGNRERKLVVLWYAKSRHVLVCAWNQSRPTGFPVGRIIE